ncbi:MAG: DUF4389 domain-containing protein [Betaproteobacteria bacterium]
MTYPVTVTVEPQLTSRDRLTTGLRPILAIPHAILVGPIYGGSDWGSSEGLLGTAAFLLAIVSWFTILIKGEHLAGIRQFTLYFLRWKTRFIAYLMLLVDPYPPFGDGPYPASIEVQDPALPRDKATVAVRLFLAIPHFIVLFFVCLAWLLVTIFAWFAILFTGEYPGALVPFSLGAMRWVLRVEAYLLLLVDEYPPFSLD